jgi:hypothetical protein
MKHTHYDLIVAWANGAEIQSCLSDGTWVDEVSPCWLYAIEYRVKPKMIKVGRHEWPIPMKEFVRHTGMTAWAFSFEYADVQEMFSHDLIEKAILEGVAHATKEAAEQHRNALRCISVGDID